MPTKICFIYSNPTSASDFEAGYSKQRDLARKLPGLQRMEEAKVWPKEDGSPTPAHRTLDLYFNDYDAACAALATPAAGALFPVVFSLATGGVMILFSDVNEVSVK